MSLSRAQQGQYRPLVKKAWQCHCNETGIDPKDKAAHETWYRQQLKTAIGVTSTSQASKGSGFEKLMKHFEILSRDGIHWQLTADRGPARRLIHSLQAWCGKHNRTEEYLRGIARQMFKLDHLPQLADLTEAQLLKVQQAAATDYRRRKARGDDPAKARPSTRPYRRKESVEEPRFPAADISTINDTDIPY